MNKDCHAQCSPSMEKALQTLARLLGDRVAQSWRDYLDLVRQMPGANRIFTHIANATDKDEIADSLAEIRYILIFAGLGFEIVVEPLGKEGPDLQVSRDSQSALVEVTRFRQVYPGAPHLTGSVKNLSDLMLEPYGDAERDTEKAWTKILGKLKQVEGQESIIAIWNDDQDMEEIEVSKAVCSLTDEVAQGIRTLPLGLMFVLYGSSWVVRRQQLYCFPLHVLSNPYEIWKEDIERSLVKSLIAQALAQRPNGS